MTHVWKSYLFVALVCSGVIAQEQQSAEGERQWTVSVEPNELTLDVGEKATLSAEVRDSSGRVVDDVTVIFYSRSRRSVGVTRNGQVEAYQPGEFTVIALMPAEPDQRGARSDARVHSEVPVTVRRPELERLVFQEIPSRLYVGTRPRLKAEIFDSRGTRRKDMPIEFKSSDERIAEVDSFGFMTLRSEGTVEITAVADEVSVSISQRVEKNPTVSLALEASSEIGRTGDVIRFTAIAKDARGLPVRGMPTQFSVSSETDPRIIAPGAVAQIAADGRFVAERPGIYTAIVTTGSHSAAKVVTIVRRDVRRAVELVGRGPVLDRRSSDLWVWEGTDGRDYAITGTWGADGHAYLWDVTDPSNIEKVHETQVDARTINDVKVSASGDIAVISREGASDRKNGFVVLGVGNPREGVPVLSEFSDQLTGGVHNIFIDEDYVYALSAGRRYDIVSIEDPRKPERVGSFELDTPGHAVHDVWVTDGVAFSSNWNDGIVAADVGGGGLGGTPERPIELGRYSYPSGWNHAAFPYKSQSTGTFYLFAGDEAYPYGGVDWRGDRGGEDGTPMRTEGWVHVIDWSDWDNPKEVARYQVPEAGSHNLWVENDILYVGYYYPGGLRIVDVSGELMGDLYRQGREISMFVPFDPDGYVANAPFVWGPQPYKGNIFFTDFNSGLWSVRLTTKTGPSRIIGEP